MNDFEKWIEFERKYEIGDTISKKDYFELIDKQVLHRTLQIMWAGRSPSLSSLKSLSNISYYNPNNDVYSIFFHAPYNLNLSRPEDYVIEYLSECLLITERNHFKGLVVHVGKSNGDISFSISRMREVIILAYEKSKSKATFLLESPCGQRNELLTTPEELEEFITSLSKWPVGLCIDTCHVFVSGIMPSMYFNRLKNLNLVKLIHFNGSRKTFGCKADGHSLFWKNQNIPEEELEKVAYLAHSNNIPMVVE